MTEQTISPTPPVGPAKVAAGELHELVQLPVRAPSLVVCRESDESDLVLLRGLVQHTLSYCRDLPSVDRARELELLPLTEPAQVRPTITVLQLGNARTVLFEMDGDYYLYSMASAAKSNLTGENEFTEALVSVLETLRPLDVYVASMSRLVRAFEHSAIVLSAVSRHVDRVHVGETILEFRGPGKAAGQMMWSTLAMVAASERDLIVQRLTAGLVAKYLRGEWIKGRNAVPLGYRLGADKNLHRDPDQADLVRDFWTWMADPTVTHGEVVRRLGEAGYATAESRRRYGPDATVADLMSPDVFVRNLLEWSDLYLTGEYTQTYVNPFEGAQHLAGLPVHYNDGEPRGSLHFVYQWGRHDVDPAIITAALRAREARRPTGAAAKPRIAPLNDLRWTRDGLDYKLRGLNRDTYEIRVLGATGTGPGFTHRGNLPVGEKVGIVDRRELHESLVRSIGRGLTEGVNGSALAGHSMDVDLPGLTVINRRKARLDHVAQQVADVERRAAKARRLAADETDPDLETAYRDDARHLAADLRRLRTDLDELHAQVETGTLPTSFDSDLTYLLTGLQALLAEDGTVDQNVAASLHKVLHRFEMSVDGDVAEWRTQLLVPLDGTVLAFGPFDGSVVRRGRVMSPAETERLADSAGAALEHRRLTNELIGAGYHRRTATAAVRAPGGYLPRALLGQPVVWPDCPEGYDHDRFNAHVREYWPTNLRWAKGIYNHTNARRQELADLVAALGGTVRIGQINAVTDLINLDPINLHPYTLPRVSATPGIPEWQPSVRRLNIWRKNASADESLIASILCPRCDEPATAVVRVPEVPDALLCRTCLVSPSLPDLPFPPLYERLALPTTQFSAEVLTLARSAPPKPLSRRARQRLAA